jgi:predicted ATP-dependent protease
MKKLYYLFAIIILASCSSPMNNKYSDATLENDLKAIREANALDSTEMNLLAMYFVRAKLLNENIDGKSYNEILTEAKIAKQKQEEEERIQKELAEKAKKEEEARIARLKNALTVTIFDKGYAEYDYQEYITYKFAFENKTDKEITAFTGQLIFTDLFDKEIKSLNLTYDDGVAASSVKNYSATTDYNQFMDEDQLLKSKNLKQIKLVWKPEKILFADGTTLE